MNKKNKLSLICEKVLGFNGRMISCSKSIYRADNPRNVVVFNANIATSKDGKLWFGDLDLTLDHKLLCFLAKKIGTFQVFREMDLRFDNEDNFDEIKAVATFSKNGVSPNSERYNISKDGALLLPQPKEVKQIIEVSPHENEKEAFEKIKVPDVNSLKVKRGHSAWVAFQEAMIKEYGEQEAAKIYQHLFLTKEDAEVIRKKNVASIKRRFPGLHKVKIEQSVAMDSFQHGCLEFFDKTPSWAEPGFGYIKKQKTTQEETS